jgi:uncharacterized protein (TIGR04255 family)
MMENNKHPQYPNPTIVEAICEIHFHFEDNQKWSPLWIGEYYKLVQEEFGVIEPITLMNLPNQLLISSDGQPIYAPQFIQVTRYRHKNRQGYIQLAEGRISVHAESPYPGWEQMQKDLMFAWKHFVNLSHPLSISRIGMRYINRIERSKPNETLEAWLTPTDYIPKAVLQSLSHGMSSTQRQIDSCNRLRVNLSEQIQLPEQTPSESSAFIFDIDHIFEGNLQTNEDVVVHELERLHGSVWQTFSDAKGPRLERLLQGELV